MASRRAGARAGGRRAGIAVGAGAGVPRGVGDCLARAERQASRRERATLESRPRAEGSLDHHMRARAIPVTLAGAGCESITPPARIVSHRDPGRPTAHRCGSAQEAALLRPRGQRGSIEWRLLAAEPSKCATRRIRWRIFLTLPELPSTSASTSLIASQTLTDTTRTIQRASTATAVVPRRGASRARARECRPARKSQGRSRSTCSCRSPC